MDVLGIDPAPSLTILLDLRAVIAPGQQVATQIDHRP